MATLRLKFDDLDILRWFRAGVLDEILGNLQKKHSAWKVSHSHAESVAKVSVALEIMTHTH